MKKIRKVLLGIVLSVSVLALAANFALADIAPPEGSDLPDLSPEDIIINIFNWLAGILALISVVVIVIAGIMWVTAGGNEDTVKKARGMILYAVIGLIIAGAAYGIVNVVVENFLQ